MDGSADLQTGFNLVLCYYATGEKERMKKAFTRLLSVRELGMEDEDALQAELDDVLMEVCARTRRTAASHPLGWPPALAPKPRPRALLLGSRRPPT